jgi:CreA protein
MKFALIALIALFLPLSAQAESGREVGHVDTVWKVIAPDHKIKVAAFEDPKIDGVTCFLSRAVTGGFKSIVGLAEDSSDAAITCQQTGPIVFKDAIKAGGKGEDVFNERRSILFKTLHVTRFFDVESQTIVYLTWSDKLIEGSPKNTVSAVTLMPWGTAPAAVPKLK